MLASETPALDVIGATFVRELEPGEMVVIDADGPTSLDDPVAADVRATAVHLRVRLHRPAGQPPLRPGGPRDPLPHGRAAGEQAPAEADMVMGVPSRGCRRPRASPGRAASPTGRAWSRTATSVDLHRPGPAGAGPRRAAQAQPADATNIAGKRLVVVDDSIVRGTTQRSVIRMLREAGAAEVHLRISSPPWRWPCFYGIDTPSHEELLAAGHTVEEMARILGADSLAYITSTTSRRPSAPTPASAMPASPATTRCRCPRRPSRSVGPSRSPSGRPPGRSSPGSDRQWDEGGATYAGAGVDIAAGEPPWNACAGMVSGDRRLRRPVRARHRALSPSRAGILDRRGGHQDGGRP